MLFSLSIIVVFVVVSIYYYFRAEKLYAELNVVKKEAKIIKKESKMMVDAFAVIANKSEEFVKFRFSKLEEKSNNTEALATLTPLIVSYSAIYRESIKGKGEMHKIAQKCCESYQSGSYNRLTNLIKLQESSIKRAWASNNLKGLISFMEAMLFELENPKKK